jgi:Kef-type K+ transport system membrane component KefB
MQLPALPPSWKLIAFTVNLLLGLAISQLLGAKFDANTYKIHTQVVQSLVMWALSFIMINVGYEFTIDKDALSDYVWDYLIAMTAAGFPWLFVAVWYLVTIGDMSLDEAFLVARFAAPTSAGILFSMLDAAGLRDTWLFNKARILAIFDDLDTIVLMIPLKVIMVGFKWELTVIIGIMVILLVVGWRELHAWRLPYNWKWTLLYALVIATVCKVVDKVSHMYIEAIHIEVLLPAFIIGCVIDTPCAREELKLQKKLSFQRQSTRELGRLSRLEARGPSPVGALFESKPSVDKGDPVANLSNEKSHQTGKKDLEVTDLGTGHNGHNGHNGHHHHHHHHHHPHHDEKRPSNISQSTAECSIMSIEHVEAESTPPGCIVEEVTEADCTSDQADPPAPVCDNSPLRQIAITEEPTVRRPSDGRGASKNSTGSKSSRTSRLSEADEFEHKVQTVVSMVFMVLVGLSTPALIGKNADDSSGDMDAGTIVGHVCMVSFLMIIGKMFPICCYRDEAPLKERFALCLGMCPRGEVGASIIVISLELGVSGPAIIISMCALVINLVMSAGFIGAVKFLLKDSTPAEGGNSKVVQLGVDDVWALQDA